MDLLANLALGFDTALAPSALLYCLLGVTLGTFIGVLPGIGPLAAISLLLPLTFYVPATAAIIMLAGVYYGAQYGGSTASILLNLPGTPSSAVACLDGYPMARQGRAGVALFMTTIASFAGAMVGLVILAGFSPAIAELGLLFGPAEYFSIMMLGLVAAATLSGSPLRGCAMVIAGLLLSMVGTDVNSGVSRFDFGLSGLMEGISLVALAMGLFGVSDVIASINNVRNAGPTGRVRVRDMLPNREDWSRSWAAMLRGSAIGSFFGALPGAGTSIASFMSYSTEKRVAKQPERFGKGAIEGVTAPEAANNAAAQTAFVPTLSLGIPGDAVMALMLGALIIHGITPGPLLMAERPEVFWGLIVSFALGNLMLLVLNIPLIGVWVSMLRIRYYVLYPFILVFIGLGVYSVNNNVLDIFLVAGLGVLGYILRLLRFEPAPLLLGFILGPMMEENLRRTLLLSRGDAAVFLERPLSLSFLAVALVLVIATALPRRRAAHTTVEAG